MMLRICPYCNSKLAKEDKEISPGVFTEVELCSECNRREIVGGAAKKFSDLFKRKAFNLAGSIAIRIPKELARALDITDGTELKLEIGDDRRIVISKV